MSLIKKFSLVLVVLFNAINLFAADLYLPTDDYDSTVQLLKDIENDRDLQLRYSFSKPKMESFVEVYDLVTPELIKKLQNIVKVEQCSEKQYPALYITKTSVNWAYCYLGFIYYENEKDYEEHQFEMITDDKEHYAEYLSEYIASFVEKKVKAKPVKQLKNAFHIIDSIPVNSYYNRNTIKDSSIYIRGFEDHSFIVRDDYGFEAFDAKGNYDKSITAQLDEAGKNLYIFRYAVGKNKDGGFSLYHPSYNFSYNFDKSKNFVNKTAYNYPVDEHTNNSYIYPSTEETLIFDDPTNIPHYYAISNTMKEKPKAFDFRRKISEAVSPKGDLWICSSDGVFIFDKNLKCKHVIFPEGLIKQSYSFQVILKDDSFICNSTITDDDGNKKLVIGKYNYYGQLLWEYTVPEALNFVTLYDYSNNIYYGISGSPNHQVYRFTTSRSALPEYLQTISKCSEKLLTTAPSKAYVYYKSMADAYYENGGYWLAYENYRKYLEYCSADSEAAEKYLKCELALLKKDSQNNASMAMKIYDDLGEESAKEYYSTAMKSMEKFKKLNPYDKEVNQLYADLKNYFIEDEENKVSAAAGTKVRIEEVDITVLFPALMNVYTTNPAGFLTVKNYSNKPVTDLQVNANIKKYMDYPTEGGKIAELKPGESAQLEIYAQLNDSVLKISEKTNVQMQFTVSWKEDGKVKKSTVVRPVYLYSKSAMTWADTGMLSCFIMPNDEAVNKFAFENVKSSKIKSSISKNIYTAVCMVNALGTIPLNYVPDPVTPVSNVIENEFVVDTVRFPGETLNLKGGDCDDMTVLFCSAMEATGVKTALITTPGHIFAAFDSGMNQDSMWNNLPADYEIIINKGRVWIPIEITTMNKGFASAWATASKEIIKNKEEMEFVVVSEARNKYPPVKIDNSVLSVSLNREDTEKANLKDFGTIKNNIFVAALDKACSNSKDPVELNSLARNYYNLKQRDKAIKTLERAIQIDEAYASAYRNLSNLYTVEGNDDMAAKYQKRANELGAKNSDVAAGKTNKGETRAAASNGFKWIK